MGGGMKPGMEEGGKKGKYEKYEKYSQKYATRRSWTHSSPEISRPLCPPSNATWQRHGNAPLPACSPPHERKKMSNFLFGKTLKKERYVT